MPYRPNEITREHVLEAVKKIERENVRLIPSIRKDVIVDGRPYPPLEVLRYAHEQLDGEKRWEYAGGPQSFKYLENLGFRVVQKGGTDPILSLITRYKAHILKTRLEGELYKWRLVGQFQGRPNLEAEDFGAEIKSLKFENLIYAMAGAVMLHLAKERPELYRAALKQLFDENLPLIDRIAQFQKEILRIYREIQGKQSDHHDERTIAAFLTYRYPDKYTFYKDSYYKKLCDLIGVKSKKTGEKLVHYLELVENLVSEYIADDKDLLSTVNSMLPEDGSKDRNHKILAQDILYQMLDRSTETGYWVFQANPKFYEIEKGLNSGLVNDWTVSAHKGKIKIGDKLILWATGKTAGCYALAEVTAEPQEIERSPDEQFWKVEDKSSLKAGIKVTKNLVGNPILWERIKATRGLENLKVGSQGTNFAATKEQYEIILSLIEPHPQMNLAKNTILYGPPGTGKTFNSIDVAVGIITGIQTHDHSQNKLIFDQLRADGQIEFVTFHQNYSYEDFVVGIRPDIEFEKLRFQNHRGIFYQIAKRAKENFESFTSGEGKKKTFDDVLHELIKPVELGEEVEIRMVSGISFWITDVSDKSIAFRKKSGGTQHTLSLGTLRDLVDGNREMPSGLAPYYIPLVNMLLKKRATGEAAEPIKNFVLIIDEINRANISRVFGELITLLEEDKRLGEPNEFRVTLPNGEKDFAVPPNLYLIGTMNTADKSIALIDIALRRRFEFVGYKPNYDILKNDARGLLEIINKNIYEKKTSPDYLIGHAYFMNEAPVETILRNKVIPLLLEYFGGQAKTVKSIFDGTEWNVSFNTETYGWDISKK